MFSWVFALANRGRHTMPVLVTRGGVIADSALIVRWASARAATPLDPTHALRQEVERVEHDSASTYGVDGRLAAYDWFFRSWDMCLPYNQGRAPEVEARVIARLGEPARSAGKRRLGLTPTAVEIALDSVDRTLDTIARRLSDGRRYLFGDTFTAADLTFAALSAPSLLPARFPVPLPPPELIPEDARDRVIAWRNHPAGRFALRLYDERPCAARALSPPAPRARRDAGRLITARRGGSSSGRSARRPPGDSRSRPRPGPRLGRAHRAGDALLGEGLDQRELADAGIGLGAHLEGALVVLGRVGLAEGVVVLRIVAVAGGRPRTAQSRGCQSGKMHAYSRSSAAFGVYSWPLMGLGPGPGVVLGGASG